MYIYNFKVIIICCNNHIDMRTVQIDKQKAQMLITIISKPTFMEHTLITTA